MNDLPQPIQEEIEILADLLSDYTELNFFRAKACIEMEIERLIKEDTYGS